MLHSHFSVEKTEVWKNSKSRIGYGKYSALSQTGGLSKEGEVSEAEVTGTSAGAGVWKESFFKSITGIL